MSFLDKPKNGWGRDSNASTKDVSPENPLFVYVKMPVDLDPFDRHERFADPLNAALEAAKLGAVTGGGTQFSAPDDEGEDSVEFCGIDIDLFEVKNGLALLRRELIRLGAPPGTVLLYTMGGKEYEDPISRAES